MPAIRRMTAGDVPLGLELCRIAGWNQIEADWRRLMDLAPDGVFVAEEGGAACGTASAISYGRDVAWIGMILVHPDSRGRGVGTALMRHCIDHLRGRGVRAIKLDATDAGRPVYLKLGFVDEEPTCRYIGRNHRWEDGRKGGREEGKMGGKEEKESTAPGSLLPSSPPPVIPSRSARQVRPLAETDWPAVAAMDRAAFGADRMALLKHLAAEGPAVIAEGLVPPFASSPPTVFPSSLPPFLPSSPPPVLRSSFGLARPGRAAWQLGPVVAQDADSARAVVEALLAMVPAGHVYWDILPRNTAATEVARDLGFAVARRLTRMRLGAYHPADDSPLVRNVYAAGGFELG